MPQHVAKLAERLLSGYDPDREQTLRQLVSEEDRIGYDLQRLTLSDRFIEQARERIARQEARIVRLALDGLRTEHSTKTLAQMRQALAICEHYRRRILDRLALVGPY